MPSQLAKEADFFLAGLPAVAGAGAFTGEAVPMARYTNATIIILQGALTAGGDETITLEAAVDGVTWRPIGQATASITLADTIIAVEVENLVWPEDGSVTNPSVRLVVSRTNGSAVVLGGVAVMRNQPKHDAKSATTIALAAIQLDASGDSGIEPIFTTLPIDPVPDEVVTAAAAAACDPPVAPMAFSRRVRAEKATEE